MLFERVVPKCQINHQYIWVCLQAVAVVILDALQVENEGELRCDVQESPSHLYDDEIVNKSNSFGGEEVPKQS